MGDGDLSNLRGSIFPAMKCYKTTTKVFKKYDILLHFGFNDYKQSVGFLGLKTCNKYTEEQVQEN